MGRKLIFVLICFSLIPRLAKADSWTGSDKLNHFSYSAAMAKLATHSHGVVAGVAIALIPGVAKEIKDLDGSGTPSMRDMTWNVVGAVSGAVLPKNITILPMRASGTLITYSMRF